LHFLHFYYKWNSLFLQMHVYINSYAQKQKRWAETKLSLDGNKCLSNSDHFLFWVWQLGKQLIHVKQTPWDATDTISWPRDATPASSVSYFLSYPRRYYCSIWSSSLFNYDISALINCNIFERNISIYIQLGTRKFKTSPHRNTLLCKQEGRGFVFRWCHWNLSLT